MFSRTTIASSITTPTASASASTVIVLIVKPKKLMNANVPRSDVGIARPMISVERQERRKRSTTTIAKNAP